MEIQSDQMRQKNSPRTTGSLGRRLDLYQFPDAITGGILAPEGSTLPPGFPTLGPEPPFPTYLAHEQDLPVEYPDNALDAYYKKRSVISSSTQGKVEAGAVDIEHGDNLIARMALPNESEQTSSPAPPAGDQTTQRKPHVLQVSIQGFHIAHAPGKRPHGFGSSSPTAATTAAAAKERRYTHSVHSNPSALAAKEKRYNHSSSTIGGATETYAPSTLLTHMRRSTLALPSGRHSSSNASLLLPSPSSPVRYNSFFPATPQHPIGVPGSTYDTRPPGGYYRPPPLLGWFVLAIVAILMIIFRAWNVHCKLKRRARRGREVGEGKEEVELESLRL